MEVELYDGTVLEFPDGTKPDVIQRVAKQETVKRRVQAKMSAPRQPEYSPLDGMSGVDRFMAGAGKATVDIGRGIKQFGQEVGNVLGLVNDSTVAATQAEVDASRQRDEALMGDTAGFLGNVAGNIATTAIPLGVAAKGAQAVNMGRTAAALSGLAAPNTYKAAAASGALIGGLQPTATGESRTLNSAIGAGTGIIANAAANAIGRIAQPIKKALSPADKRAVQTLEQAGVPLDAAQKSGSATLQRIKSGLKDNPITVGNEIAKAEQQATAFNRAVLAKINVAADVADEAVMGPAKQSIGGMFNAATDNVTVRPSSGLFNHMNTIAARSKRILSGESNQITRTVDDIVAKANAGGIDGKFYQNIRSDLSALEMEPQVSPLARELREAIDNAFEQSAGGQKAAMIRDARRLWRNLRIIEGAIDTDGKISPAKLANAFTKKANRNVGIYGQGDKSVLELAKLAKAGKRLLPDKLPNSGTTARLAMQFAPSAAVGIGSYALNGDAAGAAKLAAATYAIPKSAAFLINNPTAANYLANGLRPGVTRNALTNLGASPWLRRAPIGAVAALEAE